MNNKTFLRKLKIIVLNNLSPETIKNKNKNIFNQTKKLLIEKKIKVIAIYISVKYEVNTTDIINFALNNNIIVFVPTWKNNILKFIEIRDFKNDIYLSKNNYYYPYFKKECLLSNPLLLETIFIPLVVFDINNNRIGQGLGYYDRFLSTIPMITKIGLAFKEQKSKILIDHEKHDIPLDIIITD